MDFPDFGNLFTILLPAANQEGSVQSSAVLMHESLSAADTRGRAAAEMSRTTVFSALTLRVPLYGRQGPRSFERRDNTCYELILRSAPRKGKSGVMAAAYDTMSILGRADTMLQNGRNPFTISSNVSMVLPLKPQPHSTGDKN